jgi:hypothetical protein
MKIKKSGMVLALKEHMIAGNPITRLEAITLFGIGNFNSEITRMRKEGWVVESQKVPFAKALKRVNDYAHFVPPKNLPIKEILLTEYWINR